MRSLSKGHLVNKLRELQAGLRHAFATKAEAHPLSTEDVVLLERIAAVIVTRGMAAPATVFLESLGPMSFLGSQALHFLNPIIEVAFESKEVEQVARLLERRDTITRLISLIEAKSSQ
jgi:hypothetical protein